MRIFMYINMYIHEHMHRHTHIYTYIYKPVLNSRYCVYDIFYKNLLLIRSFTYKEEYFHATNI